MPASTQMHVHQLTRQQCARTLTSWTPLALRKSTNAAAMKNAAEGLRLTASSGAVIRNVISRCLHAAAAGAGCAAEHRAAGAVGERARAAAHSTRGATQHACRSLTCECDAAHVAAVLQPLERLCHVSGGRRVRRQVGADGRQAAVARQRARCCCGCDVQQARQAGATGIRARWRTTAAAERKQGCLPGIKTFVADPDRAPGAQLPRLGCAQGAAPRWLRGSSDCIWRLFWSRCRRAAAAQPRHRAFRTTAGDVGALWAVAEAAIVAACRQVEVEPR